jgi:diguanylate cyclase (GGDEF)-like protein
MVAAMTEKSKILVVDDEVNNIDALCRILTPAYEVIVAKNGQSAIEKAERHVPDLILLDVIMPDMTGFDVITMLKDSDTTRKIPVIFITGLDNIEDEERGLLLGAVDYIAKPFNISIVKARVKTNLQIVEYIKTIEEMCKIDALTNIANRRSLDNQIAVEWRRALREKQPVGFIMIDIDHFKKYNDTYGHPQGDTLLKSAAAVFKEALHRPADLAARWGGEEFAVLLPDTGLEGAKEIAERIRVNVERMVVLCGDGTETRVTISLGVNSVVPDNETDYKEFITRTDQALYAAKMGGRNRLIAAE